MTRTTRASPARARLVLPDDTARRLRRRGPCLGGDQRSRPAAPRRRPHRDGRRLGPQLPAQLRVRPSRGGAHPRVPLPAAVSTNRHGRPVELRRRLERVRRVAPVRGFISELKRAEERAAQGEPAHLVDMIVRLMRVSILRNNALEERSADEKDDSIRELESLRRDVVALVDRHVRGSSRAAGLARGRRALRSGALPVPPRSARPADHGARVGRRGQPRAGLPLPRSRGRRRRKRAPDSARLRARRPRAARGRYLEAKLDAKSVLRPPYTGRTTALRRVPNDAFEPQARPPLLWHPSF